MLCVEYASRHTGSVPASADQAHGQLRPASKLGTHCLLGQPFWVAPGCVLGMWGVGNWSGATTHNENKTNVDKLFSWLDESQVYMNLHVTHTNAHNTRVPIM